MKPHRYFFSLSPLLWRALSLCVGLLFGMLVPTAHAACNPINQPSLYVGPMGGGSLCTHATIQAAIDASTCSYGNTIYISRGIGGTQTYSNQHLRIVNKNLTLVGDRRPSGCGSAPPYCDEPLANPDSCINVTTPAITLDGNNTDGSVINILGSSNVMIRYLEIKRGDRFGSGGGIAFLGAGSLSLLNSSVSSNQATYGGGINVETWNGDATLNLYDNVTINGNTAAESGGGVRVAANTHSATLNAVSPRLFVYNNEATSHYGGGVEIVGRVTANIGSATPVFGTIYQNRAAYGGGIAVLAGPDSSSQNPVLNLFSTDGNVPVGIIGNTASRTGGGIFLKNSRPSSAVFVQATANLWDFQIDGNDAQNGAAVYTDVNDSTVFPGVANGISVTINGGSRPASSVACTESTRCNSISGNRAVDANGVRTAGSVILMQENAHLYATRFRMENNSADHVIQHIYSRGWDLNMSNCLIANNDLAKSSVVRIGGATEYRPAKVKGCTFANNVIAGNQPNTYVVDVSGDGFSDGRNIVELFGNIFAQPSTNTNTVRVSGGLVDANYNLAREISSLGGGGVGNFPGGATFVNAAARNYRLLAGSLGVDYAPALGGVDLAGNARDVDIGGVSNLYGPRDLGAFEVGCQSNYFAGALCSLDVDGDNVLNTTDSQMMLRRLFGFKAAVLRNGLPAAGSCAQRTNATDIETFVQSQLAPQLALSNRAAWDIDGDGIVNPLTDGLLVLRAVLGLTGTAVTNGAIGSNNPARATWASVKNYLNTTCGMALP